MTTNEALFKLYLEIRKEKETDEYYSQEKFGFDLGSDKKSINDWFRNKNQLKFSKLEELLKEIGLKPVIKIENL
jgi:hypothetical protein